MVEVSPSTEIILKESFTLSLTASCSSSLEISTSVVTKASMVHIFGWIMPEPLLMPPMVTVLPPISTCSATSFAMVSVVMMAQAASWAFSWPPPSLVDRSRMPASNVSKGICIPMTPVEAQRTEDSGICNTSEATWAVFSQ